METSITNETVSQQTVCGDPESLNLEISKYTEPKLAQSKEKTEIEQTKSNLMCKQEKFTLSAFHHREWLCTKAMVK